MEQTFEDILEEEYDEFDSITDWRSSAYADTPEYINADAFDEDDADGDHIVAVYTVEELMLLQLENAHAPS